jgi:2-polyprenyl-3-methyl-5-hydroxy-6-metoxy-1,4-benzoquinol methylase
MRILRGTYWRMQLWLLNQMRLSGRSSKTYRSVYNDDISKEGVEFQVKTFYEISDKARRRRLKVLLDALSPCEEDSILDMGCGVGTFAFYSAKADAQAIGVDYSIEAIKIARLLSGRYELSTDPLFLVADATKLPFKGTLFNKVICADFIEHVSILRKKKF